MILWLRTDRLSGGNLAYVYSPRAGYTVTVTIAPGPAMLPPDHPAMISIVSRLTEGRANG